MSEHEEHDLGLSHDLPRILARRGLLGLLGGFGAAAALAACGSGTSTTATSSSTASDLAEIPEETAGPYPGDGSNGPDVLGQSGVVRSDLTRSFGSASGVAEGVPVTLKLKVYDLKGDAVTPLSGGALYLWHCDREGRYSMYDDEILDENYLRGVQEADEDGNITFTTIFPACYDGRWPHMHFEVYESLANATSGTPKLRTSQLALPEDACKQVYETEGYEGSVANFERVSLDTDMMFGDGHSLQVPTVTGSVADGFTVSLNVPV